MLRVVGAVVGLALATLFAGAACAQAQRSNASPQTAQAQPDTPPTIQAPPPQPSPQPAQPSPPAGVQLQVPQGPFQVRVIDTPIQVQVVEPPKTEAQFDAEQKERDDRVALTDQLSIYGGLLVALAGFLAVAFAVQAFYLGLTLRAVRRAADMSQRNMAAAQRAFVYLGGLEWSEAGTVLRVAPIWDNSGTTPTRGLRVATNWKASHGELAGDFPYSYVRAPEHLFLGPGSRAEFGTVHFPIRDVQAALEERMFLYVWGRATYEDLFEGSQPHFFEFCYRIDVKGSVPNNLAVNFTQYGLRNRCDDDAKHSSEKNL
jgi:hypothetical protein